MRPLQQDNIITIPQSVTIDVKSRCVRVKGPRGLLTQQFKHVNMDIKKINSTQIKVTVYHGLFVI